MSEYNVHITAHSIYDLRDIIEKDYYVKAESKHEAEIASLKSFWGVVDDSAYSIDDIVVEQFV